MEQNVIKVNGMWFQVVESKETVSMISREYGRYTGYVINTMSGKQVLFSHNGHRYQHTDAIAAFEQLIEKEGNRLHRDVR